MTDTDQPDHWPGLHRLPDPLAGRTLPGAEDPSAHALLEKIVDGPARVTGGTGARGRYALLAAVAAVAVVAFGAVLLVGREPVDVAPLFTAIDRTDALESGQLEIVNTRSFDGTTVADTVSVRFRGDDEDFVSRPDPSKALADIELGPDGFVPDLLEVRTVDGRTFMRVTADERMEVDGTWMPTTWEGGLPYVTFAERVRRLVEGAEDLDRCSDDGGDGVSAYCLSTSSNADVQQLVDHVEFGGSADVRIEIDDATGLLSTFEFRATGADLVHEREHFDLPTYDVIESRWVFEALDPNWQPELPELG